MFVSVLILDKLNLYYLLLRVRLILKLQSVSPSKNASNADLTFASTVATSRSLISTYAFGLRERTLLAGPATTLRALPNFALLPVLASNSTRTLPALISLIPLKSTPSSDGFTFSWVDLSTCTYPLSSPVFITSASGCVLLRLLRPMPAGGSRGLAYC